VECCGEKEAPGCLELTPGQEADIYILAVLSEMELTPKGYDIRGDIKPSAESIQRLPKLRIARRHLKLILKMSLTAT
jgi:hypothetical protein